MTTNWAFHWCRDCGQRLASPGEWLCDRCEYDWDMRTAQIKLEIDTHTADEEML